jgi:riboflavin-specific deaminase-like protein
LLAASTARRDDAGRDPLHALMQDARGEPSRRSGRGAAAGRAMGDSFGLDGHGARVSAGGQAWLSWSPGGWTVGEAAPAAARPLLELFAPVCGATAARPLTVGHLGQSLDGCIATASGDSYYVTGPDNVVHLHRLRALCDAVVVGAGTIERDDALLTVRHVEGPNPVRVILDPNRRLGAERRVFGPDAPTLLITSAGLERNNARVEAEVVGVPASGGKLDLRVVLAELRARGLLAVFVEGGGATVSSFLEAGLLDRLQIAVAPLVTGSGRPGLTLSARDKIAACARGIACSGWAKTSCSIATCARPRSLRRKRRARSSACSSREPCSSLETRPPSRRYRSAACVEREPLESPIWISGVSSPGAALLPSANVCHARHPFRSAQDHCVRRPRHERIRASGRSHRCGAYSLTGPSLIKVCSTAPS